MFSYEKQVDTAAEPETFTVPTALMRTGNFSELLSITNAQGVLTPVLIFDPATAALRNTTCTAGSTGTTVCRTPFTGNIIPENRLNAAARAFLNLYPLPNQPGIQNGTVDNYFSNQLRRRPYDSYLTRIDHNFNGNHRIYAKVFYSKSNEDRYNFIGEPDSITQGFETRTNKGGNVNYTATLSSNFVLDVRSSLNQFGQKTEPANPMSAADLGFTGIAPFTSSTVFPRFLFTNYDTLGAERAQFNEGLNRNFKLFSLQPTLTQIFGDHTLKYGYDYRRLMENRITNLYNAGSFSFTGAYTSQASNSTNQADIGRDLAAFLLGIPTSSTIEQGVPYDVYSNYHGFFVQDDWRVSPKLTLNLGLRYDLETGVREAEGRIVTGFDTTSASPLRAGALANFNASVPAGVPITAFQNLSGGLRFASGSNDANQATDKNNFQPRIGVSYALNDKTVIRGGFGIFTSAFQIQPIDQSGFTGATSFTTNSNDNGRTFLTTLNNPFPNGLNPIVGSSLGLNTLVGNIIGTTNATGPTETTIYSYDRKNANYARFIFGVQRQLPFDIGVEATFVYSRGSNLPVLRQLNYIPREYLNNLEGVTDGATILNAIAATASSFNTVPNPFRGLVPQNAALNGQTINRRLLLTQFPQFNDLIVTEYNGSNTYRSLQLQANKRLSSGFSFNASYTLARDKEKTRRLNPQDEELNETLSNFDRPHRITFSGVFELPFGRNRKFFSDVHPVVDAVFGGWQFNAIYEWQSGEPLVLQNVFYNGDITQLENLLGKSDSEGRRYGIDIPAFDVSGFRVLDNRPTLPNGNVNPAFNTLVTPAFGNNYTVGSQNTLRYLPYTLDNFRNQPFQKFDVGLTKNFQIREGMRLQVRVEAINALNTPYFGAGLQLAANNAAFGRVTGQRNLPRDIQLGARFTF
jgi:hypothetical protein